MECTNMTGSGTKKGSRYSKPKGTTRRRKPSGPSQMDRAMARKAQRDRLTALSERLDVIEKVLGIARPLPGVGSDD